jgi:phage tail sheath protein FI
MALQPTFPGVFIEEVPSGVHTIPGVTTSVTAFLGYLKRGPLNIPVQCLDFASFQRVFGGLDPNSITSFQVSQFFLNGGAEAWVSRLCAASAPLVQPAITLRGASPPDMPAMPSSGPPAPSQGTDVLHLQSQNPGIWGGNVFVTVDYTMGKPNTFNLTATLYSISGNSYAVLQIDSMADVTLDLAQPNSIVKAMQTSNPYAQLLAVPDLATTPSPAVPFASGTTLTFAAPNSPVSGVSLTVAVAPAPAGAPATVTFNMTTPVGAVADLIAGIEGALSNAAGVLGMPSLAHAEVRGCRSPFAAAGSPQAQLVQVRLIDPTLADVLIGISCNQPLFSTLQTNTQAQRLTYASQDNPNGLVPTGFDVAGNATARTGIYALDAMPTVNLLLVPDMPAMNPSGYLTAAAATLDYAMQRKAFAILDLPNSVQSLSDAVAWATSTPATLGSGIINCAIYYPQVQVANPFSTQPLAMGACGTLAGIYAMADQQRGVWKAPAGISASLAGVQQLSYVMNDRENGELNPLGVNALRSFPVYGNVVWGARTLAAANLADEDRKYVPVRRLALYIEQSLMQGLKWVVFEPNDEPLWAQIRLSVNAFLLSLFRQGAFAGQTPSQAFACSCDASTTTAQDIANGIVNIVVMFAPLSPAEFIVITLQQMAGQASS